MTDAGQPEGYEIAFHTSLSEPITIGGAPRVVAIVNATFAAIISLGLQVPWIGIPFGLAIHAAACWAANQDPYVLDALGRHLKHKPYLDA